MEFAEGAQIIEEKNLVVNLWIFALNVKLLNSSNSGDSLLLTNAHQKRVLR